MKKYLGVGVIVQALIIVLRTVILKKVKLSDLKELDMAGKIAFGITIIVGGIINIVIWPISIICEIINTIKRI